MKIYTKQGDLGCSQFAPDMVISKTSDLFGFYGDLDELNSFLGFACSEVAKTDPLKSLLWEQQKLLLKIGGRLTRIITGQNKKIFLFNSWLESKVNSLEEQIDVWQKQLPVLDGFIVPGGSELAARLHLARSVCRRAERGLHKAAQEFIFPNQVSCYINRLSDWLYVAALVKNKGD